MFKKLSVLVLCALCLTICWWINGKPIFNNVKGVKLFEIYQRSNSSSAQIQLVDALEYKLATNKYGEACVVEKQGFNVQDFFNQVNANVVFVEKSAYGTSYYGFSNKIKYSKKIYGKKINIHVFVGESQVKIASPMIFGSY